MKPITINELGVLLDTPKFTGGFFATKTARLSVLGVALSVLLGTGFGTGAWGIGSVAALALALVCLILVPATIRKRYAASLISDDVPQRLLYLYRKYKTKNRMARWIDQWYEEFDSGSDIKPSQMLVILQHTWSSAYSGLSAKRDHLNNKHRKKTQALNTNMNNGKLAH